MKRVRNNNKKQLDLLGSARELFWRHGFRRVSVEEVCAKAGVSKMTFYRYFPHKLALAQEVFDREVENGLERFRSILSNDDLTPDERIHQLIEMKFDATYDISPDFLRDFYTSSEPALAAYVEGKTAAAWQEIVRDFRKMQEKGIFRKDIRAEVIILLSNKMGDLVKEGKMQAFYGTSQEMILDLARFFMYGVAGRELKSIKVTGGSGSY